MKTVLLTGCTGFLGSHLLRYLYNLNVYNIVALKRSSSNTIRINDLLNTSIVFIDVDLLPNGTQEIYKNHQIDILIHTATSYGKKNDSITEILNSNLIFPISLLEDGIRNGLNLFINTDSYFNKPNQTYKTLLDYSLSKKSLNIWLEYLSMKIKIVNLRLEHVFGDYDNPDKFVEYCIQEIALKNVQSIALTYGQQKRDFVYVDDVCEAYRIIIENYEKFLFHYLMFEVGTGEGIKVSDFVSEIKRYSESSSVLEWGAVPYREDEIMCSKADNLSLLNWGWECKYNYKTGIKKIIDIYRSIR